MIPLPTSCPSAESLAAYADGGGTPAEREAIESHLAVCEDCFEQVAAAAAFAAEESLGGHDVGVGTATTATPQLMPAPPRRMAVGWWLAAAAALLLAMGGFWVPRLLRVGEDAAAMASLGWVGELGRGGELAGLATLAWTDDGGGFAFGSALSPIPRAVRLGVRLLDARVALAAGNEAEWQAALARLEPLLLGAANESAGQAGELAALRQTRRVARRVDGLARVASQARAVAPAAFDLGAWSEAGRLAALGDNPALLRNSAYLGRLADFRLDPTLTAEPAAERALTEVAQQLESVDAAVPGRVELVRAYEQLLLVF